MLYKYFNTERISVLSDNLVRFTQTSALNDPFESALLLKIKGEDEIQSQVVQILHDLLLSKGLDANSPESVHWIEQNLPAMRAKVTKEFQPAVIGKLLAESIARKQGVFSLSRVNDNLLMWAHYAESHRGFVLGIDETHYFFNERNSLGDLTSPKDVVYSSMRVTNTDDIAGQSQLMRRKSIDWAYEEEVRVFKNFPLLGPSEEPHALDKVHLFLLPSECIKQVFIGANSSPEDRARIIEFAGKRSSPVDVFETCLSEEKFELHFTKV
jgi:hypothetical protein